MLETEAERVALIELEGSVLTYGAEKIPGFYNEARIEAAMIEGVASTFTAYRVHLEAAGITVGSSGLTIAIHDGRTRGPFRVKNIPESEDDGAYLTLGLELE